MKTIGIIIDIHNNLADVKKILVDFTLKLGMNGRIYVATDDIHISDNEGESVGMIANYQRPRPFHRNQLISQTLEIIGNDQEDGEKIILIITNKDLDLEEVKRINHNKNYGCKFVSTNAKELEKTLGEIC